MKKRLLLLLVVGIMFTFLTGCMESYTSLDIQDDGMANVQFSLIADEIMAGDESNIIAYGLRNSIMQLQTDYIYSKQTYDGNIYQTFKSKYPVDISEHEFITFTKNDDGTYIFKMEVPQMLDETTDNDSLMFTIHIRLPKDIDMANTIETNGNEATWYIYKNNLTKGMTLKAMTK